MGSTSSRAAIGVTAVVVTALVVVAGAMGSLGSAIALGGGALVVLGAALGRLWLALVPATVAAGLAALLVTAPSPDVEDWAPAIATLLVVLGIAASLCVALGALIRRLARSAPGGKRSD